MRTVSVEGILEVFQSRGCKQLATAAMTEKQTLIDHIYISQPHTHDSYHSPVYCFNFVISLSANTYSW